MTGFSDGGGAMTWHWRRLAGRVASHGLPDPWDTLALQIRLGELSTELRRIEQDPGTFARAHHYLAAQGAYDALLRQACRLTGVQVAEAPLGAGLHVGEDERFREEVELSSRGWSW